MGFPHATAAGTHLMTAGSPGSTTRGFSRLLRVHLQMRPLKHQWIDVENHENH
jgi:hypothetical protein